VSFSVELRYIIITITFVHYSNLHVVHVQGCAVLMAKVQGAAAGRKVNP